MNINLKKPLVYVARDIERALGMTPEGNYFVISNDTPFGREIQRKYPTNVRLVQAAKTLDTHELLDLPEAAADIDRLGADIVVFLSTPKIERICAEKGWKLLNPSAALARRVEEKISQIAWLGEDASLLPPHKMLLGKEVHFEGKKFVLQFNHAHTGQGTYVIDSVQALEAAVKDFPERECRVVDFIDGPVFTVNAVAAGDSIIVGNPSYQITGIFPFTDLPFSTVGNDWNLPRTPQMTEPFQTAKNMAETIGRRLGRSGWKGLFGIDVIYDPAAGKTYLLEINARQAASAVYESTLQKKACPGKLSIFEAHVSALLGIESGEHCADPIQGAQIVKRVTERAFAVDLASLKAKGLAVMEYENSDRNKELFRIQSAEGIMKGHGTLNDLGTFITSCIKEK